MDGQVSIERVINMMLQYHASQCKTHVTTRDEAGADAFVKSQAAREIILGFIDLLPAAYKKSMKGFLSDRIDALSEALFWKFTDIEDKGR